MKKVKCIKTIVDSPFVVGETYYLDKSSCYIDSDGDEYGKFYADELREKYVGIAYLLQFCLMEDGNCLACKQYHICNK